MLWLHALVFFRIAPIIGLLPGFGEQSVPMRIKLILALAFTLVTSPALMPELSKVIEEQAVTGHAILAETLVGIVIGIGLRLFLMTLQMAGSIAAQSTSLSQILGSASVTPLPAMGHLLVTGGLALMMLLGLHLRVAELIIHSYRIFPATEFPAVEAVSQWGVARIAHAFSFGFTLAAPFVLVSVLYNLTLGIINRAMPQLMVVFVGAPAITALALFLLMLVAPVLLVVWVQGLAAFIANPFGG
ncbi:flagellar biosynthetic protein FliR [uncultured Roseovarius sp.]|uniref:flagellar biosynthetic protein FliR n=1 Tax=uncultured Roseovarius sp. TaxID=293344 RepID=UPI002626CF52|nr:flagellar biosynthetic protein FliR [uncultured Roseovarius sp.]